MNTVHIVNTAKTDLITADLRTVSNTDQNHIVFVFDHEINQKYVIGHAKNVKVIIDVDNLNRPSSKTNQMIIRNEIHYRIIQNVDQYHNGNSLLNNHLIHDLKTPVTNAECLTSNNYYLYSRTGSDSNTHHAVNHTRIQKANIVNNHVYNRPLNLKIVNVKNNKNNGIRH